MTTSPRDAAAAAVIPEIFAFKAIGTAWKIATERPLLEDLRTRILERIERFDVTYSRFRPDSLVSQIAAADRGGRFTFPADALALFSLYDRLHEATDGAVDPLVGRDLELLGYDAAYSLVPAPTDAPFPGGADGRPTWRADVARDGRILVTHRPLVIDVGAAGKGYLVDIVSAILREAGIAEFVVDASGDLRHVGERTIRVGLEHPADPRRVIGVANLQGGALCASATNRRAWGDGLHHLLDARTGLPAREVVATWVLTQEAATADGLATALFVSEPRRLAQSFRFEYVRVLSRGGIEASDAFDGEIFT